jgi:plasmid segregation protein ParM
MVKNFGQYDAGRVIINDDICAAAKGYEALAQRSRTKNGGIV